MEVGDLHKPSVADAPGLVGVLSNMALPHGSAGFRCLVCRSEHRSAQANG